MKPDAKELFQVKYPNLSIVFWDIKDPQDLLENEPKFFFEMINNRADWFKLYLFYEREWDLIVELEAKTKMFFSYPSELDFYKRGGYKHMERDGKYWLFFENDRETKIKLYQTNLKYEEYLKLGYYNESNTEN